MAPPPKPPPPGYFDQPAKAAAAAEASASSTPPTATPLSYTDTIADVTPFIPITLDLAQHNYYHWRHLFEVHLGRCNLRHHVAADAAPPATAAALRASLRQLFQDNADARINNLHSAIRNTPQGDSSLSVYCQRIDTSPTNPSKEIFSELDEINAHVPILPGSIQNTREPSERGHVGPTHGGGAARPRASLVSGPTDPLRGCPFAYLKPPSRNPSREPRYGKPSRDAAAANPISGDSGDRLRHPAGGDSSPGGLFIAMIASGVMSE
ncbi:hypothetical protein QYE76_044508 [Lolium multiflorum]|uniref:Uncharacterized protein n=1 Tax=Lolium multiflorum TaxID=4521 RepID=A0AAD8TIS2_LOLMU|nr:hypothetical protein QYE76_044508 [Lolium multiflorum]